MKSGKALLASAWAGVLLAQMAAAQTPAHAPTPAGDDTLQVSQAWVRGTVEGQTGSGAFMHLRAGRELVLVGAHSAAADRVELHEMLEQDGRMHMRRIDALPLPATREVALDHAHHLMLIGLHGTLQAGQKFPLVLELRDSGGHRLQRSLSLPIQPLGALGPPR
jgi:copper(I)-binding protein